MKWFNGRFSLSNIYFIFEYKIKIGEPTLDEEWGMVRSVKGNQVYRRIPTVCLQPGAISEAQTLMHDFRGRTFTSLKQVNDNTESVECIPQT